VLALVLSDQLARPGPPGGLQGSGAGAPGRRAANPDFLALHDEATGARIRPNLQGPQRL
jgi:hypothetical protein